VNNHSYALLAINTTAHVCACYNEEHGTDVHSRRTTGKTTACFSIRRINTFIVWCATHSMYRGLCSQQTATDGNSS